MEDVEVLEELVLSTAAVAEELVGGADLEDSVTVGYCRPGCH